MKESRKQFISFEKEWKRSFSVLVEDGYDIFDNQGNKQFISWIFVISCLSAAMISRSGGRI